MERIKLFNEDNMEVMKRLPNDIILYNGDCLDVFKNIPDGSVDLVLTDMPYGTIKGSKLYEYANMCNWDDTLDMEKVWKELNRITRPMANILLFAQEPFSTKLINSAIRNIPFAYKCIWKKDSFANPLITKKACVSYFEDIMLFLRNKDDYSGIHPLREYFKKILDFIGFTLKEINKQLGHRKAEHCFYVSPKNKIIEQIGQKADDVFRFGSGQFELCTEATYSELIEKFSINKMIGFLSFSEIKSIHKEFQGKRVFNLPKGKNHKSNIFEYKKDYTGFHPTQKPVALLKDLIQTYSNENETVLDFTMGSGSTGVACVSTNRKFIGIEKYDNYYSISVNRISQAMKNIDQEYFELGKERIEKLKPLQSELFR